MDTYKLFPCLGYHNIEDKTLRCIYFFEVSFFLQINIQEWGLLDHVVSPLFLIFEELHTGLEGNILNLMILYQGFPLPIKRF